MKKLTLNKETLTQLGTNQARLVAGGLSADEIHGCNGTYYAGCVDYGTGDTCVGTNCLVSTDPYACFKTENTLKCP